MNAQSGIGVGHILRVCDGIYNILDSHRVVLVPNQSHLIVLCMYATSIVANVPSTSKVLCKTSNIATIGVHQSKVAIGLQQSCSELGAWRNRRRLGLVGIQFFHVTVAARCSGQEGTANHTCKKGFLNIFGNHN